MSSEHHNAQAGPSTLPELFLPPQPPPRPAPQLTSTQDLLARFHLLPAYDKYVRPAYANNDDDPPLSPASPSAKGKERELTPMGDDEKGEKKKNKNSYKHLIKGIPGKHSMKKDDFLTVAMAVPPKERLRIAPFDLRTQREAFSVSLEGLKGWNTNALVLESAQAREDRKKRKELKKLAKAQSQQPSTPASAPTPGSLPQPANGKPRPPVINTASAAPTRVGTPRTATPRTATPVVTPMQRTGTPVALPASANTPQQPPPLSQAQPPGQGPGKKGKKRDREREENGASGNSNASLVASVGQAEPGQARPVIANAKAGTAGIRPRPLKKQRMDSQGQARDILPVQQQPTPQGA
ncbi:hypothetical protein PLICRDRAFT_31856 [Plicaturopsis crispa FD-325 SS-3]|uniref:Mediator of RNA polymerase II transcription subunit 19 n=1 Tax=Plicaturopsis crispa FD-325 SS-3 TaxID=944288 RepID=A0A0C9T9S0_PLICR|nr:hypothetical protein PLICRDRAFT_31856 [Plicaturopsis crispa FD-325 SS-3]